MGHWKDIGVVPDSDDEGWDSEDDLQQPLSTINTPPCDRSQQQQQPEPPSDDRWDIPVSPASPPNTTSHLHQTDDPRSSALTSLGTQSSELKGDLPSSLPLPHLRDIVDTTIRENCSPGPLKAVTAGAGADNSPLDQEDVSPSIVQINALSAGIFHGSSLESSGEAVSLGNYYKDKGENHHGTQANSRLADAPPPTASEPPRGRRSLRPRKPIQQHPYLLESARYSKALKSHGLKPIRIARTEGQLAARRRQGKDSQDNEYMEDESLSAGLDPESQDRAQTSKRRLLDGDLDELAASQSPRTSPPQRHLRASSEQSSGQITGDTSIHDDEDFPDIRDLTATKQTAKKAKRRAPPELNTSRKRLKAKPATSERDSSLGRRSDAWELPPAGTLYPASRIRDVFTLDDSPQPSSRLRTTNRSVSPPGRPKSPLKPHAIPSPIGPTALTADGKEEQGSDTGESSADSESDLLRRTGRRIKGTLPASWVRLDQQRRKDRTKSTLRKPTPSRSPGQPRQGLASRKAGISKSTISAKAFFDKLNEDDNEEVHRISDITAHDLSHEKDLEDGGFYDVDDNESLIEEELIDRMLMGQKRSHGASAGPPRKRNKTQQKIFKGQKRYRQPKISESVHRLGRLLKSAPKPRPKGRNGRRFERAISPPALSIVDFIEPNAPNFIKVAARAVRKHRNMGRSKPCNKRINLGNRVDNLDALGVLQRWRSGQIKQRAHKQQPSIQSRPFIPRKPLRPANSNARRPAMLVAGLSFRNPPKLTRQVSMTDFVSVREAETPLVRQPDTRTKIRKTKARSQDQKLVHRPAQLETEVLQGDEDVTFSTRKKMLDLVFRKSRKEVLAPTFQLCPPSQEEASQTELVEARSTRTDLSVPQLSQQGDLITRKVLRSRKRIAPRRLDLDAPQYVHANDPLPFFVGLSPSADEEMPSYGQECKKIVGLGPFGTHYTQNFDVFPLHRDTFFHHITIIGNGTLEKALNYENLAAINRSEFVLCFNFSDHRFQWGPWSGTTSSELGLLFDEIAEDIGDARAKEASSGSPRAVDGAENVLKYVLDFVSVNDDFELRSFTQRMLELLEGFINHVLHSAAKQRSSQLLVQITSRFLICALVLLRLCQRSAELSNEVQQAEDVLRRLAKGGIESLRSIGLSEVASTYDDLQRLASRERGIRADKVTMTSWVVVMKVLGSAQIPRAGFWDLMTSTVATDVNHVNDAQILESLWRDMFTLLPLTEFDDAGILSHGLRHVAPLQGWALPQMLLKAVFESYQGNQRQSPSFNGYLRALLGRCHCLVEQWGWYSCVGVVGTIFDFFGGQNLSHLRNEEVFTSPQFLEELSNMPYLAVEPQDSCFHVFLKTLAVAIRKLKCRDLTNHIRNLIARCLPNHNRQYSKELAIHSHDLASLRNHHDLLCTLFWAAPPELRRPVELVERLVQPASSHKEACLINLRAWNQLARFVVSSGSSMREYRPFMSWQNNVFQQVLNQYLSAPTDVQQQFMSMAKEDKGHVQQHFLDSVVAANQRAAKDVLYVSVRASLDVVKHCPSLTAAMFSFNVNQMAKVFSKLSSSKGNDLDWAILRASFGTVDVFVKQIERVSRSLREASSDSSATNSNREVEDAVDFLDDKVIQSFMTAVRKAVASPACEMTGDSVATVVEKAIVLCGRIASLFIEGGRCSLLHFFSAGKYGLFGALPDELSPTEWTFVPLFVATLLKNHVFNFSSIGCAHFDIWISCLVKPFHALRYAANLGETLRELDMGYMMSTGPYGATTLDYEKNRDLFANGILYMRRELRQADLEQRKPTKAKYEKLLTAVMRQIKSSLKSLQLNSAEHRNYISFVREIVGLIKSHGVGICQVDPFFFEVSAEYSPPMEDPRMHMAGVLAYGIKLAEGETMAVPQLFHYLYNHFKTSLTSGQLEAESKIITKGMGHDKILAFVIGRMLPAIIRTSSHSNDIWPLLGTYSKALQDILARSCLPREIPDDSVDDAVALLTAVLDWVRNLGRSNTELTASQAHIFTDLVGTCNAIRPSLASWLQQRSTTTARLRECVAGLTRVAKQAASALDRLCASGGSEIGHRGVLIKDLVRVETEHTPMTVDMYVDGFTQDLLREVQTSWVVTSDKVTVRVAAIPSTQRGTQATQGARQDILSRSGLLSELLVGLKAWVSEMDEEEEQCKQPRRRRRLTHVPLTLAIDPF